MLLINCFNCAYTNVSYLLFIITIYFLDKVQLESIPNISKKIFILQNVTITLFPLTIEWRNFWTRKKEKKTGSKTASIQHAGPRLDSFSHRETAKVVEALRRGKVITSSGRFHCCRWRSGFKIVAPRRNACRKRKSRSCGCRRSGSTTPRSTALIRDFWHRPASTPSECCPIQASRRITRSLSTRPGNESGARRRIGSESIVASLIRLELGQAFIRGDIWGEM